MFLHGPPKSEFPPDPMEFHNFDPGTAEIWLGGDLIGLAATSVSGSGAVERWAIFHGGAVDGLGNALGIYPAKDLPPEYHPSNPFTGPVTIRKPASSAPWRNLHTQNGSLAAFKTATVAAVGTVYSTPTNGGILANADWVEGTWTQQTLTRALIDQTLVPQEHKVAGSGIHRWFETRRGGQQLALTYAEHRDPAMARVVHQVTDVPSQGGGAGMSTQAGDISAVFFGQGGTHTLASFLNYAKQKQTLNGWVYTRGTCTWHD